jgi:hypothetical protein
MAYNNPSPSQSTTLTADERSREARKILTLLRNEPGEELERRLTDRALGFVQSGWLQMELGGQLNISENQLLFLRDIWSKFA